MLCSKWCHVLTVEIRFDICINKKSTRHVGLNCCKAVPIQQPLIMPTLGEVKPILKNATSTTKRDLVQRTVPPSKSNMGPTLEVLDPPPLRIPCSKCSTRQVTSLNLDSISSKASACINWIPQVDLVLCWRSICCTSHALSNWFLLAYWLLLRLMLSSWSSLEYPYLYALEI